MTDGQTYVRLCSA